MDPINNPFSPGAGSPPPELVGRSLDLEQARILLGRVLQKRPEKSMLLTGLRGVGKTVLLKEIQYLANKLGYRTLFIEAHENKPLASLLIPYLRGLLFEMNRVAGVSEKVRRGLRILRSFIGAVKLTIHDITIGIDIEPEEGSADSGDLEVDLPDLFLAIGEAAEDCKCAVALLIDEIQYFNQKELGALIMAMHKVQQHQLPLVLFGTGLPLLPGLAGEAKSYSERLFNFPDIGALSQADAAKAIEEPARAAGVYFEESAVEEIYRLTNGYPYFLQEWAYQVWNLASASPITLQIVQEATEQVIPRLDKNFFKVRFERLTPNEKFFLRAMAELGPGVHRIGELAALLNIKPSSLSPVRADLIKKGMIYSPAYGELAFTVPLFDKFMIRTIPDLKLPV
ncbi:MAG: AAA family ATPase [Chlamydiales bacterium]|nr:AAA family ATPase [Chlamydiales bacterium]